MARPTKLTPEKVRAVYETLRAGGSHAAAAASAGVDMSTLTRWRQRGQAARSGIYRELADGMSSALSAGEALAARAVISAFTESTVETIETTKANGDKVTRKIVRPPDARMALEWLARRSAKHWNLKQLFAVGGDPDNPVRFAVEGSGASQPWEHLLARASLQELRVLADFWRALERREGRPEDGECLLMIAGPVIEAKVKS